MFTLTFLVISDKKNYKRNAARGIGEALTFLSSAKEKDIKINTLLNPNLSEKLLTTRLCGAIILTSFSEVKH